LHGTKIAAFLDTAAESSALRAVFGLNQEAAQRMAHLHRADVQAAALASAKRALRSAAGGFHASRIMTGFPFSAPTRSTFLP